MRSDETSSSPTEHELRLLARRIRVAYSQEPGDLCLTGGQVVNVFTGRVERANVVISDGWIAGVGPHDWQAHQTIALKDAAILPGLIDSHMHLESTLLAPGELARLILPHGTTATISDSHEVGNVLGIPGIDTLISASQNLPLDLFFMASSCVPAAPWDDSGATLGPSDVRALLDRPRVLGLAEMMDMAGVLHGERAVLEKILSAEDRKRAVDGHAAGLSGLGLMGYASAGIRSDHEATTAEEARARASLGMLVQVREGSSARNLKAILPALVSDELSDCWTLVTDDIFPNDLRDHGHIDGLLRRVVAAGVPPAIAVRQASLIPARHYGLMDRGAVAPGYRADLAVVEDLRDFRARHVFKNGQLVAESGRCLAEIAPPAIPAANTVHLGPIDESAFRLALAGSTCPVIGIMPGQITTRREMREVLVNEGHWAFDAAHDVALIASIERHRATGRIGRGLVSGFGLKRGAIGSSVAHDSHNLIVAGTNAKDLMVCVRALAETGGGFVAAADGELLARLPLPFAGLLSLETADVVCRQLEAVRQAAESLGCALPAPFGTLSFLALPVIPELRITDQGLYDVSAAKFMDLTDGNVPDPR